MNQARLTTIDIPALMNQLHRASIGYDSMFDSLHRTLNIANPGNYPPHDIVKHSENSYTIELAVAGFKEDELDVSVEDGLLTISGNQTNRPDRDYVYQGISARSFTKTLKLAEHVVVGDAKFENGMLVINVDIVLPEELKPRRVEIKTATKQLT